MPRTTLRKAASAIVATSALTVGALSFGSTFAGSSTFPGDNGKIVYVATGNDGYQIMTVNPDGSGATVIFDGGDDETVHPTWSPDGTKIAFATSRDAKTLRIWVMNADGSDAHAVSTGTKAVDNPTWSPDGTKLAYDEADALNDRNLWVMHADGTSPQQLTSATGNEYDPTWSPDGSQIAFTADTVDSDDHIWVMDPDGSNQVELTTGQDSEEYPNWSPDGTKLAFRRVSSTSPDGSGVTVVDADGTNAHLFPDHNSAAPAWSPDGTKLAYDGFDVGIAVANPDGSGAVQIVANANPISPDWQPANAMVTTTTNPTSTTQPTPMPQAATPVNAQPTFTG